MFRAIILTSCNCFWYLRGPRSFGEGTDETASLGTGFGRVSSSFGLRVSACDLRRLDRAEPGQRLVQTAQTPYLLGGWLLFQSRWRLGSALAISAGAGGGEGGRQGDRVAPGP